MTNSNDDGHGPETCNYNRCNAVGPKVPCPFVRDQAVYATADVFTPRQIDGEKIQELARKIREADDEHEHQYTIPVEWKTSGSFMGVPSEYIVTKLRCACGDEVER